MKRLVTWICFFTATINQASYGENQFNDYRLGNYSKAVETLANQQENDAVADYYLGRLYLYGYGLLKNSDLAMQYFTKSAEKGYLPAIQLMAKYNVNKEKNLEQAAGWFKAAANQDDISAQLYLAAAYLYGVGVKKNVDTATHYFIDAAKKGNPIAQFALAETFLDSKHHENRKLGLIWLTKSANANNPKALTKLGVIYLSGTAGTKDISKGLELLNKAAGENYIPAMLEIGDVALAQNEYDLAIQWYNKAAEQHDSAAYLRLAHAYFKEKTPIYNAKTGFLWTLKAAQAGSLDGQKELADLYQKGIGVETNPGLAQEWTTKFAQSEKDKNQLPPLAQASLWLSNGATDNIANTAYRLNGIFSSWHNPSVLANNRYNQAPQLERVSLQDVFNPQFTLIQPNDIAINSYYDALISKSPDVPGNQWTYPNYPLNPQIESLEQLNSPITNKENLPVPYIQANYYLDESPTGDLLEPWTHGWQKQVNYTAVFNQMYFRAILGDPQSQFEIGQMFQYGIGVAPNIEAATIFYQNAAEQQHLGATYNLGILYLEHARDENDYQMALNRLTDAAFKGNKKAQYVLARLLDKGKTGLEGQQYIQANPEQALSLLYLSAANDYGLAEYELAEHLAREHTNGLSVQVRNRKVALIRQLYTGAAAHGVAQALLPLAYYDAMEGNTEKQAHAFSVAEREANNGEEKAALLLGLLYDRGIGVSADPAKAMYWYQQAGKNPVSQFILGTYAALGKNMPVDKEKGMIDLQGAADGDFSYANFNLAVLQREDKQDFLPQLQKAYALGNSHAGIVLADYYLAENTQNHNPEGVTQAKDIYLRLAEKGDQYAQLKLAYMWDKGLGAPTDPSLAQQWYVAAAEQGNPFGQYLLGQFYQRGELGEPNYDLAKMWYGKAAPRLPKASVALGFLYETVEDNYELALKEYEKAASAGDPYGEYNLALMYAYGKGRPVDLEKAKMLFASAANKGINQASEKGNQQAKQVLNRLEAQAQEKLSFIEPILINSAPIHHHWAASRSYLNALNEWNHGHELLSRMILERLVTPYPNFIPAKQVVNKLNQAKIS